MGRLRVVIVLLVTATTVHADTKKRPEKSPTEVLLAALDGEMNWGSHPSATFAFEYDRTSLLDDPPPSMLGMGDVELVNPTVGFAADGTEAFVAGNIRQFGDCGGGSGCGLTLGWLHGTFLLEKSGAGAWSASVWHISKLAEGAADEPALPRKLDDAGDAVKLFESTLGDPKAFARTVSDRKEVVLIGSDKDELFVGGANVRAKLIAWNLRLEVRDGVQAGLSQNKTFAWVAANVAARRANRPKDKPMAYRLLAIYEKTSDHWKLVSASFSN